MLKALRTTLSHAPRRPFTIEYPEVRAELPERSRGLFKVVVDVTTNEARCRACTLCETNCPVQVIRLDYRSKYDLPVVDQARIAHARMASQGDLDLTPLPGVIEGYYEHGTGLVALLQDVQELYGYLPRAAIDEVSLHTGISLSQIYGVASFYNQFRLSPIGKHLISVCHGTACHVAGASAITSALEDELGIDAGKTTSDREFTLGSVACMGACSQAPVMRIDDQTYGNLTPDKTRKVIRELMTQYGARKG